MKDELARAQAKLEKKNIYISACDKKIDALQKKIALLTRLFAGRTVWQLRTDTKMDLNAEPQLNKPASKLKKVPVPPAQPSVELESQSKLDDRYLLSAESERRRRVAKECSWTNQDPSKKNEERCNENQELRKEVDQVHVTDNSKLGYISIRPKISEGTFETLSQQEGSETVNSCREADQAEDAEGEGNRGSGQRVNSPLSQSSSCGSDWANIEKPYLEKERPYD